jgi:nicotinamide phosphoribosyltransferase
MSTETKEEELEVFRRLIKMYPSGVVSLVSDTYDFFQVVTKFATILKDDILNRVPDSMGLAKVVFRPDSGNPVDIICGTINYINHPYIKAVEIGNEGESLTSEEKGVIELLWDIFGGTINEQGYKVLDPHIGMIYGEAINQDNIQEIFSRLEAKGFAATNCFFGQGSYSMTYVTRDTWGMALKCIAQQKDGQLIEIFKDPITDGGMKKSAKGLTVVYKDENGEYYLKDQATVEEVLSENNQLKVRFKDGQFYNQTSLTEIRQKINNIL